MLSVYLEGEGVEVVAARVDGRPVAPVKVGWTDAWLLDYWAAPEAGIELELAVHGEAPLQIRVVDRSEGPPELPGAPYTPRPADMMPLSSGWLVLRWIAPTFVGRTFELP